MRDLISRMGHDSPAVALMISMPAEPQTRRLRPHFDAKLQARAEKAEHRVGALGAGNLTKN